MGWYIQLVLNDFCIFIELFIPQQALFASLMELHPVSMQPSPLQLLD